MNILRDIADAEDSFVCDTGSEPKFIIISAADAGELAYEVAKRKGMDDDSAYTYNVTHYDGKIICVVFDHSFNGFVLA